MPTLKVPHKIAPSAIRIIGSRIPKADELIVLNPFLLNATIRIGDQLKDCSSKWAIGGDVGEILQGVNVKPDHISILTTKPGCEEISKRLNTFRVSIPFMTDRELARKAEIDLKHYPITVRSYLAEFNIDGQRLDVHGDLQIRVANWDWGDPLDYEPEYVQVVTSRVPVLPLQLKTELYTGLGWLDRVKKIREAMARRHHQFSP